MARRRHLIHVTGAAVGHAVAVAAERFSPAPLIEHTGDSLRGVARRLGIDPALLCRPLRVGQADRYAVRIGVHPAEIWREWWSVEPGPEDLCDEDPALLELLAFLEVCEQRGWPVPALDDVLAA